MREILGYFTRYIRQASLKSHIGIVLILSVLIWINYHFDLYLAWQRQPEFVYRFFPLLGLFTVSFSLVLLTALVLEKQPLPRSSFFYILLFLSPAIFALKAAIQTRDLLPAGLLRGPWEPYLEMVLQWPLKAAVVITAVVLLWIAGKFGDTYGRSIAGLNSRPGTVLPYLWLLLAMVPLLLLAAGQEDFQQVYPKAALAAAAATADHTGLWLRVIFFEICYGVDFFTIELFFRGFLVLAFARYVGLRAILPIAVFYCTIHFGKPLAECISSLPGGLILGVIVYHTRSIWGGLLVHLGIAWGMEITGWLARAAGW